MNYDRRDAAVERLKAVIPWLADKQRIGVRLHPRAATGLPLNASKIGGMPLWPKKEPWPIGWDAYVGLIQLRRDEFPEIYFPDTADLLQILWCPSPEASSPEGTLPEPLIVWRREADVVDPLLEAPPPERPERGYAPRECSLHPERVTDYPPFSDLPDKEYDILTGGQDFYHPDFEETELYLLYDDAACAPGSKVAGYTCWRHLNKTPLCECSREMFPLVGVASHEFQSCSVWDPDAAGSPNEEAYPTDLFLNDSDTAYFFYCPYCETRPTAMEEHEY